MPASDVLAPAKSAGVAWVADVARELRDARALTIVAAPEQGPCVSSRAGPRIAIFDGVLYNREELTAQFAAERQPLNDADLVLLAYERWKLDFVRHINSVSAIVVVDPEERQIVAVRDPMGSHPLFYAEASGRVLFSTSPDALRTQPGVDREVNRVALADHLCSRWPDPQETFFRAVRRVPPGHLLRATSVGITVSRYWDPAPLDRPIDWVTEDELQSQFDRLFEQAVERALGQGRPGIFLSGGLDSVGVAAVSAVLASRGVGPLPLALSLGFPGDANEETEQRGVAAALGLGQEFVAFDEAVPPSELLTLALGMTRMRPAPLHNTWLPAYTALALLGKRRGVEVILGGAGGDEWLSVSPYLAADLLRSFDVPKLGGLMRGWLRSYNLPPLSILRSLLWKFGSKPLASSALERLAPRRWHRSRVGRVVRSTPDWLAPDPGLRAELDARVDRWMPSASAPQGFYLREVRRSLDHPLVCMELEEMFETGRQLGLRFRHPFWDAEVVHLLYRTPPQLLQAGGRAKSVVRGALARRFPGLGFGRQKKRSATTFYRSVLLREVPELWRRGNAFPALTELGIVERGSAGIMVERSITSPFSASLQAVWDLMNLEAWVGAHQ